uniref:Uncharacterized protein n=2 Tax=Caenorhabditis japonica TaxID=281687 RepID=A0A8R1I850_CAEJA
MKFIFNLEVQRHWKPLEYKPITLTINLRGAVDDEVIEWAIAHSVWQLADSSFIQFPSWSYTATGCCQSSLNSA